MATTLIDRLHRLQTYLLEIGVARNVLALPAPRMLSLPAPSTGSDSFPALFSKLISDSDLVDVCRDLYVSGFYAEAVKQALTALDKAVQKAADVKNLSGVKLMQQVFSADNPVLVWSERASESEKDEHKGYQFIYAGTMLGIRNPSIHELKWLDTPEDALEVLVLVQHLMGKLSRAYLAKDSVEPKV